MDRKRWIAEDHFWRQNFGIHTISDTALEMMKKTVGRNYKFANDPPNYLSLYNQTYIDSF